MPPYIYNNQGLVIDQATGQVVQNPENPRNTLAMQAARDNTSIVNNTSGTISNPNIDQQSNTTSFDQMLSSRTAELTAAVDKYIGDLRNQAQGNYDFAIKWITKQHETALGANDPETAKFFEAVADGLEKQIGRIPYDYMQKTEREQQDIALKLRQQNLEQDNLLAERKQFDEQQALAKKQEKEQLAESMNSRGLLGSGLQAAKQQELDTTRQLNTINPALRQYDYRQQALNLQGDVNTLTGQRNLQDIKTTYRRAGLDSQDNTTMQTETQKRTLEQRLAELNAQQDLMNRQAKKEAQNEMYQIYG